MSSRFYPVYQVGNPQLRVFLPNFWMKLVKPTDVQPPNVVQFKTPLAMTDHDIKSYLEKIYGLTVIHVSSKMEDGRIKPAYKHGFLVKEDDFRRAFVTLPRGTKFTFPDLLCEEIKTKSEKEREDYKKALELSFKNFIKENKDRPHLPCWYSV